MKRVVATLLLLSILLTSCANLGNPFRSNLADRVRLSLVLVEHVTEDTSTSFCTGFVVDSAKGWALTARHCVPASLDTPLWVDKLNSHILKRDEAFALVEVPVMVKPPLSIRRKSIDLLDQVYSFGYGLQTFMVLERHVAAIQSGDVALDGPLMHGMSGGPTVDEDANVIGLNQMSLDNGLGIVCGQDEIREFLKAR